ncbi:hypothetical protein HDU96_007952 [Phlyctochytrium bullatum]|nr:hypothetical protein HDU96_007952 [Phlyctochytrium bullatum]
MDELRPVDLDELDALSDSDSLKLRIHEQNGDGSVLSPSSHQLEIELVHGNSDATHSRCGEPGEVDSQSTDALSKESLRHEQEVAATNLNFEEIMDLRAVDFHDMLIEAINECQTLKLANEKLQEDSEELRALVRQKEKESYDQMLREKLGELESVRQECQTLASIKEALQNEKDLDVLNIRKEIALEKSKEIQQLRQELINMLEDENTFLREQLRTRPSIDAPLAFIKDAYPSQLKELENQLKSEFRRQHEITVTDHTNEIMKLRQDFQNERSDIHKRYREQLQSKSASLRSHYLNAYNVALRKLKDDISELRSATERVKQHIERESSKLRKEYQEQYDRQLHTALRKIKEDYNARLNNAR